MKIKKDSMEYDQMQRLAKIMTIYGKLLIERAKHNGVTLKELMDYLDTTEGYNSAVQFSTQVYSVGLKGNIFKPLLF